MHAARGWKKEIIVVRPLHRLQFCGLHLWWRRQLRLWKPCCDSHGVRSEPEHITGWIRQLSSQPFWTRGSCKSLEKKTIGILETPHARWSCAKSSENKKGLTTPEKKRMRVFLFAVAKRNACSEYLIYALHALVRSGSYLAVRVWL